MKNFLIEIALAIGLTACGKTFVTTNHYFNPNTETILKVIEEKEIEYEVE